MEKRVSEKQRKTLPTIGLLIDWLGTPYHANILFGIDDFVREKDVNLFAFITGRLYSNYEWEKCRNILFEFVNKNNVDGLVVLTSSIGNIVGFESVGNYLRQYSEIPIVTISDKYTSYPSVIADNEKGMRDLLNHLIEYHGYRKIAFITGPRGNMEADARFRAYTEELKEHQIPLNWDLIVNGDFLISSGKEAVKELLDKRKMEFDVIVAANDTMALGVIEELKERNIQVPENIPVVGFDDVEISQYATLTTVRQSFYDLGRKAGELILDYIRGKEIPDVTFIPTQLVIRDSCGCFYREFEAPNISNLPVFEPSSLEEVNKHENSIINEIRQLKEIDEKRKNFYTEWIPNILTSFILELNGTRRGAFISMWRKMIFSSTAEKEAPTNVKLICSIVKNNILEVFTKSKIFSFVELLFQQVEGMIEEAIQREKIFAKILFEYELEEIEDIGERLIATLQIEDEIKVAMEEFPKFGIKSCFLSLYEDIEKPLKGSRLIMAYDENNKISLPKSWIAFPTQELIPSQYFPENKRFSFLVEDLFQGYKQIGFIILDFGTRTLRTYEILRHKMSVALNGAMLIEKIKNQADYLEEEVKARTKDLIEANNQLKREIQEREKAEENLKQSEERFREMALLLPTVIFETDTNLNFTFINKSGLDTLGLEESALKEEISLLNYIHPDDRKRFQEYCDRVIQGASPNFREFRINKKDGSQITLMTKASPIYRDEMIDGIRWNAIDIKPLMSSVIMPEETFFKEHKFSPREKEVLLLMLQGYKIKDIAKRLFITESTVKGHIGAIYAEIGASNREEFFKIIQEYQINHFGYQSFIFSMISKLIKE